jgi:predicted SAM-dependent methyltransferase
LHLIDHTNDVSLLMNVIAKAPKVYRLWMLYVYFVISNNKAEALQGSKSGASSFSTNQCNLASYGLSMFPKSPELLLLQAWCALDRGDGKCSAYYRWKMKDTKELMFNNDLQEYFNIFEEFSKSIDSDPISIGWLENKCVPSLETHGVYSYQILHELVSRTANTDWAYNSVYNSTKMVYYKDLLNPWVPFSVLSRKKRIGEEADLLKPISETTIIDSGRSGVGEFATKVFYPSLQVGCSQYRKCARPGWLVADALKNVSVHFVTLAYNLSMIDDASVGVLYSSHTLEHLSHNLPLPQCTTNPKSSERVIGCASELSTTLSEWRRVLVIDGKLLVSVPDLAQLFKIFANAEGKHPVIRKVVQLMTFGGQINQYDFHKTGFYFEFLVEILELHHFCNVTRVPNFNLFHDTSSTTLAGEPISLNIVAQAC